MNIRIGDPVFLKDEQNKSVDGVVVDIEGEEALVVWNTEESLGYIRRAMVPIKELRSMAN